MEMKKTKYEKPEIEIIQVSEKDILTSSEQKKNPVELEEMTDRH